MMRKTMTMAAIAMMASVSVAKAEEHTVIFLGQAFFPSVAYVKPGDTVKFVNGSPTETYVVAEGNEWWIGPIDPNGQDAVQVTGTMELQFFASDTSGADMDEQDADNTHDDVNAVTVEGALSFDDPAEGS
jgi:plastocyanin